MARSPRASRARRPRSGRTAHSRTSYRTGAVEIFLRPQHSWWMRILGWLIRLRAELAILTVLLVARYWAWPKLENWLGHTTALLMATVLVLSILVTPASRRYLNRRWWAVTTRHRLRACFLQTRTMTHDGKLPFLLWSRPSPVGERVRVWLPAGLSVKDLERVTAETAAACWASEVRLTPNRRQAALVVVDVIRRDPLTGDALTPQVVDDLDTDRPDPGRSRRGRRHRHGRFGTVVPLPVPRSTLPPPPSGDIPDTGHRPAAGRGRTGHAPGPARPGTPPGKPAAPANRPSQGSAGSTSATTSDHSSLARLADHDEGRTRTRHGRYPAGPRPLRRLHTRRTTNES